MMQKENEELFVKQLRIPTLRTVKNPTTTETKMSALPQLDYKIREYLNISYKISRYKIFILPSHNP